MAEPEYVCRRAVPADRPAILELCRLALGWSPGDPDEEFFAWKHDDNAFGSSPSWVAEAGDGTLIGLRVFLRWRFTDAQGRALPAVRAVDTATHPAWRGKGIFTALTLGALAELAGEGISLVFNTPNGQSLPGYLKMGWSRVGKVPIAVRPASLTSLRRMSTARTAAELWSEPVDVGAAAAEVFADHGAVDALLRTAPRPGPLATDRTPDFLHWRYRFGPLHYRVVPLGEGLAYGVIVFRARRRGGAVEAAICDVIAPPGARLRPALRHIARQTGADYLLAGARSVGSRAGFLPAAGIGPVLTWRPVDGGGIPAMADLGLVLGDIELF